MLFLHGFGEHSGRYENVARWFAHRGRLVHAYDQLGHGLSAGRRGHVSRFDDYLDDLEAMLERVTSEPGRPLPILVGHSLGGLISATLACERKPEISKLVLSGPALELGPDISRLRMAAARILRRVVPRFTMEAGLDPNALSRDPEVVRDYQADSMVHGRMSAALAAGMLERVVTTAASASQLQVPVLLLHGEEDALCPVSSSRAFFEGLDPSIAARSEIKTYPGLRHEIFNEPEREQVYQDLFSYVEKVEAGND